MTARFGILLALVAGFVAQAAVAGAPTQSPRPDTRPGAATQAVASALLSPLQGSTLAVSLRPLPRPTLVTAAATPVLPAKPVKVVLVAAGTAVRISPRPDIRPENLKRRFIVRAAGVRTQPAAPIAPGKTSSVCGDPAIKGTALASIAGRLAGCGVADPVRITSVDGVALSRPATLNCTAARALKKWVSGSVKPAVGRLGGGVASLRVAADYSCRSRNNQKGAKISEHGRGNAIDISAIVLKNGVAMTVLKGWNDQVQGKILQSVHRKACGTFGTVLGPRSDKFHQDHLHLDVASYRSGPYCR